MRESSALDSGSLPRSQMQGTWGTRSLWHHVFDRSTALLAVALAGAWLSNLPLGVMAGYLMAGVALVWAVVRRSWSRCFAQRCGCARPRPRRDLLAPRCARADLGRHRQATEDPGYNFENNWLFARHANPLLALHDAIMRQALMDRRLHDRRGRRRNSHRLAARHSPYAEKHKIARLVGSLGGDSHRGFFLCFPSPGPFGICCPRCVFCSIRGDGLKRSKRRWQFFLLRRCGRRSRRTRRRSLWSCARHGFWRPQCSRGLTSFRSATPKTLAPRLADLPRRRWL